MDPVTGRRLLAECEETSLEEILDDLRTTIDPSAARTSAATRRLKLTHMPDLDRIIAARHASVPQASTASICGRSHPLLNRLIGTLVSPPHQHALLVIDLDARFDATRVPCDPDELKHIYVLRPARRSSPEDLRAVVAEAHDWLLYGRGASASAARCLWGTIIIGGLAGAGDVVASWRGWLRVDRAAVPGFALGSSAEEAFANRAARQKVVDEAGWSATSEWGSFVFLEDLEAQHQQ